MPQPIIILRTVSIEKLSNVLNLCKQRWPDHPIHVITSANREGELKHDHRVSHTIPFTSGSPGFSSLLAELEKPVASIVIPIGNQSGRGYGNVFQAIPANTAEHYFIAPYCHSLAKVSHFRLQLKCKTEQMLAKACFPLAQFWTKRILKDLIR